MDTNRLTFNGMGVGENVAIGNVFLYTDMIVIPMYNIEKSNIENEYRRFDEAIEKSKVQINDLQRKVESNISQILSMHIIMLDDKVIQKEVKETVYNELKNIDYVYNRVMLGYAKRLSDIEDTTLSERASDIMDIKSRVLKNMLNASPNKNFNIPSNSIIVAKSLIPSDTLHFHDIDIAGFVLESGGVTSHSAILAKSLGIAAVFGIKDIVNEVKNGEPIIVDSGYDLVIVNPNKEDIDRYSDIKSSIDKKKEEFIIWSREKAFTKDGYEINVYANIDIPEELDNVLKYGVSSVGLYRTEFLYFCSDEDIYSLPDEERQFEVYKYIATRINGRVIIRTLDIGGDKIAPVLGFGKIRDDNPFLGWRAIRFCLSNKDIFKVQIRAILRASAYGGVEIMLPMISTIEEVIETKSIIEDVKECLRKENYFFNENIKIGVLIETPSAAITADLIVKEVDFFSIGSNDLVQYTMACDRTNDKLSYLYNPIDISVLRIMKNVIDIANENDVPITLCGEMGGTYFYTPVLLGLGLRTFSMSVFSIAGVKNLIRSVSINECEELVSDMMKSGSNDLSKSLLNGFVKNRIKV